MRTIVSLLLSLLAVAACGGAGTGTGAPGIGPTGTTVGATCRSNADCASLCVSSDAFAGMCSVACRSDVDCPDGTSCVQYQGGGICAVACSAPADCAGFGSAYTCDNKDRFGAQGSAMVCRIP